MMGGGLDGARRLMSGQTLKPKNVGATLARFWKYFSKRWYLLVMVAVLMIISTWTQVTAPEILGQAVDCYLFNEVRTDLPEAALLHPGLRLGAGVPSAFTLYR